MTTAPVQRHKPVQARSRRTVTKILDAAAAIINEEGIEAATTRAIADRAGVSYPSLYRFFADRDEILERLCFRHLSELAALGEAAERTWEIHSVADLFEAELDRLVAYYREHPNAARLWLVGRSSTIVLNQTRANMRALAERMHAMLINAELIPPDTDPRALLVAIEIGDRILEMAYRESNEFDPELLDLGRKALIACANDLAKTGPPVS
ncbi:MAG: TetR/AcrR family transcriptional regulator, partial [Mycobacterium sp.]|nr:TetR/AcrR family transcriptional regulator [Mycobacterium sp.]